MLMSGIPLTCDISNSGETTGQKHPSIRRGASLGEAHLLEKVCLFRTSFSSFNPVVFQGTLFAAIIGPGKKKKENEPLQLISQGEKHPGNDGRKF